MANTRELRRRIRSVKNTAQITRAMQMVAATKMKKAQAQAQAGRPYSEALATAVANILPRVNPEVHALLQGNNCPETAVLMLSTDKSLCGALNTNLFRMAQSYSKENLSLHFYSVGGKGRNFIIKTGKDLKADFENPETVTFRQARQVAGLLIEAFLNGECKEVYVLYPHFVSALRQVPTLTRLLPLEDLNSVTRGSEAASQSKEDSGPAGTTEENNLEFLLEPTADDLLDQVLTHFAQIRVYQVLLETKASEHSARMIAMQNATDNAKELVEDLQLTYNQTRQDNITRELLEITSAQAALQ